jgi:hypothetical protein
LATAIVSERPADALDGAQALEQIGLDPGLGLACQESGKAGETVADRFEGGNAMATATASGVN